VQCWRLAESGDAIVEGGLTRVDGDGTSLPRHMTWVANGAGEPDTTHRLIIDDPIISLSGHIRGTVGDSVKDPIEIATKAVGLDSPKLS
jgi:hypothetical protein